MKRASSVLVLLTFALVLRAGAGDLDMSWRTIDSGGGTSGGGDLVLSGTIGQPDAGDMVGGDLVLSGGFWPGSASSGPDCPGDFDDSGDIGFSDLLAVLSAWGPCPGCPEDLDASGDVGFSDLLAILAAWGPCV